MSTDAAGLLRLAISYRSHDYSLEFPQDATVQNLFKEIENAFDVPISNQKIFLPKGPLLKWPPKDPDMALHSLQDKKLRLMGSGNAEVQAVNEMADRVARRATARSQAAGKVRAAPSRSSHAAEDARYTFQQVRPLTWLPHPERSEAMLLRLKADPGIRSVMQRHRFTVALLTEMEPLSNTETTHQGTTRTFGLNRNKGEVIELRLRTDSHAGYRDYKTVRRTLCHELTHNVHGPHDAVFWELCRQIEREVEAADWKSGGQSVGGNTSRYVISGQVDLEPANQDEGGWTGGEFVLGQGKQGGDKMRESGLSRREILAQAALTRQQREAEEERKACDAVDKGWKRCPGSHGGK
ncbi:hypothetical protein CDD82_2037 [Ophiocordyceps australis]|uniref:WLM domain-containing protein n=1 Tax=Ophiocordyceps australis TaxID=1399860 RepID=A0A2C5ZL35_9HYPO|nr:hypothetical protein CDD82_2037 [Ophiocordyceps australis]